MALILFTYYDIIYMDMSNIAERRKNMQNIESLIVETLKLFSEVIDIADGELRTDNGFFLSNSF